MSEAYGTEGQRLLAERSEVLTALAKLAGVPKQRIIAWRSGTSKPTTANAKKLRDTLGIPLDAWSRVPGSPAPEPAPPVDEQHEPTALEEVNQLLAALRHGADSLTEKDRSRRSAERARLLALKARIEHQERLAEDAIVRAHPHWKKIREALRTALAPHPEALAAVHDALAALGEWEAAVQSLEEAQQAEEPEESSP